VVQELITIPVRDGSSIPATLFKPEVATPGPLVVLYHAGAFVIGYPEMQAPVACHLVQTYGAVVLSVGYRKAPEHPFPTPIHDSWDALKWCASNATTQLGSDPAQGFLVGGDSLGGGNIAAVLSHIGRDEKLSPPLTGVWLAYPATVAHDAVPEALKPFYTAYKQNLDAPGMLKKDSLDFFRACYNPDPSSDLFNVLGHSNGHSNLPKTFVQVCGLDPLRDDGLLYERELRQQGTKTKLNVYAGVPHTFDVVFKHLSKAKQFDTDREAGFAWLLSAV
jgi:acetyl esterase/lipase